MARDLEVIRAYAEVSEAEARCSPRRRRRSCCSARAAARLPEAVAPGLDRLGFMLPYTPMHHLMLRRVDRPVVMT